MVDNILFLPLSFKPHNLQFLSSLLIQYLPSFISLPNLNLVSLLILFSLHPCTKYFLLLSIYTIHYILISLSFATSFFFNILYNIVISCLLFVIYCGALYLLLTYNKSSHFLSPSSPYFGPNNFSSIFFLTFFWKFPTFFLSLLNLLSTLPSLLAFSSDPPGGL